MKLLPIPWTRYDLTSHRLRNADRVSRDCHDQRPLGWLPLKLKKNTPRPPRFDRLPHELRHRIVDCTDRVALTNMMLAGRSARDAVVTSQKPAALAYVREVLASLEDIVLLRHAVNTGRADHLRRCALHAPHLSDGDLADIGRRIVRHASERAQQQQGSWSTFGGEVLGLLVEGLQARAQTLLAGLEAWGRPAATRGARRPADVRPRLLCEALMSFAARGVDEAAYQPILRYLESANVSLPRLFDERRWHFGDLPQAIRSAIVRLMLDADRSPTGDDGTGPGIDRVTALGPASAHALIRHKAALLRVLSHLDEAERNELHDATSAVVRTVGAAGRAGMLADFNLRSAQQEGAFDGLPAQELSRWQALLST